MSRFFNVILSLLLLTIAVSCKRGDKNGLKEEKHNEEIASDNEISTVGNRIDSMLVYQKRVLEKGDTNAYKELKIISVEVPINHFFFWSFIMANKYDYAPAYSDVFNTLIEANICCIENISDLDKRTRDFAIQYLTIGAKKGDSNAVEMLKQLDRNSSVDSILNKIWYK